MSPKQYLRLVALLLWVLLVACQAEPDSDSSADQMATELPPAETPTATVTAAPPPTPHDDSTQVLENDILAVLDHDGRFTRFLDAMQEAGMLDQLAESGPLTVLAPDDEAFEQMSAAVAATYFDDPDQLARNLAYHLVDGFVPVDRLAQMTELPTQLGPSLIVRVDDEGVVRLNSARLVESFEAANGLIHQLDNVLVSSAPMAEEPPDLLPEIEGWEPYPEGEPLPIAAAELVPGHPVIRDAVGQMEPLLATYSLSINTARAVRLTERGETVYLAPPMVDIALPRSLLELNHAATLGDPNAPVTIVEFSDFECPFCARFAVASFPSLVEQYVDAGLVYYVYKDLPVDQSHPNARMAAQAARCAGEQDHYWLMHEILFGYQSDWSLSRDAPLAMAKLAEEYGLDPEGLLACMKDGRYEEAIQANVDEATELGIGATPTFFVNGYPVVGAYPYEGFAAIVDAALQGYLEDYLAEIGALDNGIVRQEPLLLPGVPPGSVVGGVVTFVAPGRPNDPGGPYLVVVPDPDADAGSVLFVDVHGEIFFQYEAYRLRDTIVSERPAAGIFIGTKFCKISGVSPFSGRPYRICFPCSLFGQFDTRAACLAAP